MTFVLSKPLAAELWAAAQLSPGETVADAIPRIGAVMARSAPATPTAEQGAVSNAAIAELIVEPVGSQVKRYTNIKADVYDVPPGRYDLVLRQSAAQSTTDTKTASQGLSDAQIEDGWHKTFSTSNPYCPCNLKSFTKSVRWAERAILARATTTKPGDAA